MTTRLHHKVVPALLGVSFLGLVGCKGNKTGYEHVVDYASPQTGLSQQEYPFDAEGNYLEDVVAGRKVGKPATAVAAASTPSYVDLYETPEVTPVSTSASTVTTIPASYAYERPPERTSPTSSSSSTASKPTPRPTVAAKPKPAPKPAPKPTSVSYTVRKGDTLYSLANRYGTSVAAIKSANGLRSDLLKDGRTLKIPKK